MCENNRYTQLLKLEMGRMLPYMGNKSEAAPPKGKIKLYRSAPRKGPLWFIFHGKGEDIYFDSCWADAQRSPNVPIWFGWAIKSLPNFTS